jgi:hypothetical protein
MIKNFIYLDEQKLYSFSSQLFEGITEYFLNQQGCEHTEEESQKGKLTSGRVIADVVKEAASSTTKKFLHDHAFNLFEAELLKNDLLLDVSSKDITFDEICLSNKSFIRIRSKGKFVDISEIQQLFIHFNEIGKAIATSLMSDELQELDKLLAINKNSKEAKELQSQLNKAVRENIAESQLCLPKVILDGLDTIIEQFFGSKLVYFKQFVNNVEYSSCMDPQHLRESIQAICKKYARKTAKEFVVIATICHSHNTQDSDVKELPEDSTLLSHLVGLAENLYEIEQIFGSKGENEIIIEPIAIYTEL